MKKKKRFGKNQFPRIQFECHEDFKKAVDEKLAQEGHTVKFVGIGLWKQYLALPVIPKGAK